jgi:Arc/MetJ family transcription regulator
MRGIGLVTRKEQVRNILKVLVGKNIGKITWNRKA